MSSPPPSDRAALGRARLAARARRIATLRRRVVAATLATFALAWGVIAWQGEMGAQTTQAVQVARVSATATTAATATATATAAPTPTATATSSSSSSSSSDLTTSQS